MNRISKLSLVTLLLTVLAGSASLSLGMSSKNIVEFLDQRGNFSTLISLVEQAGLADTLANGGPFTLQAPTDDAFADLAANDPDLFNAVVSDNQLLAKVLLYHVIDGRQADWSLVGNSWATTLLGEPVLIYRDHRSVFFNHSMAERVNYRASNGNINVIGSVLVPPAEGTVLSNIMDVLKFDSRFSTLVSLLESTGLDSALENLEGITIFAPTNDAFDALAAADPDLFAAVLADSELLTQVLLYHVSPVARTSVLLAIQHNVPTLQGAPVKVMAQTGAITVNGSIMNCIDIRTPNGVIHGLDSVLLPPL